MSMFLLFSSRSNSSSLFRMTPSFPSVNVTVSFFPLFPFRTSFPHYRCGKLGVAFRPLCPSVDFMNCHQFATLGGGPIYAPRPVRTHPVKHYFLAYIPIFCEYDLFVYLVSPSVLRASDPFPLSCMSVAFRDTGRRRRNAPPFPLHLQTPIIGELSRPITHFKLRPLTKFFSFLFFSLPLSPLKNQKKTFSLTKKVISCFDSFTLPPY